MEATDHHPNLAPSSTTVGTPARSRRQLASYTPSRNQGRRAYTSSPNSLQKRSLLANSTKHGKLVPLAATYVNLMLYALCFQLQRPVEPFLVEQLSSSSAANGPQSTVQVYGYLQSFFSAIQTFGSPLVGILLDRVGVRLASTLVFVSSAASYGILAGAETLSLLFLSKLPAALQHAFLVAQATAAVSTSQDPVELRAQALGRMTTAYTVGATFGPIVGGWLAERGDFYIGAKLAVLGSLISVVISLAFLPKPAPRSIGSVKRKSSLIQDIRDATQLITRASLWPLLTVKVLSGVSSSMFQTALPLVLTQQMHYEPSSLGMVYSSSMLAAASFGALGISLLIRACGTAGLARLGLLSRTLLVLGLAAFVSALPTSSRNSTLLQLQVVASNVLIGIASHALATSLTTQTTGAVEPDEQGALLGLEHGLFSLARVGGPPLGSWLLSFRPHGFWAVAVGCGIIDVGLVVLLTLTPSPSSQAAIVGSRPAGTMQTTPVKAAYQE